MAALLCRATLAALSSWIYSTYVIVLNCAGSCVLLKRASRHGVFSLTRPVLVDGRCALRIVQSNDRIRVVTPLLLYRLGRRVSINPHLRANHPKNEDKEKRCAPVEGKREQPGPARGLVKRMGVQSWVRQHRGRPVSRASCEGGGSTRFRPACWRWRVTRCPHCLADALKLNNCFFYRCCAFPIVGKVGIILRGMHLSCRFVDEVF